MSIERGHAAGVSSSVTQRPGGGKGAAAQGAAAGGDFLSMLAALADGLPGGEALALAAGDAQADAGTGRGAGARADRKGSHAGADDLAQEGALAAAADGSAGAGAAAMAALLAAGSAVAAGGPVAGAVVGAEAVAKLAHVAAGGAVQGDASSGPALGAGGRLTGANAPAEAPEPPPPGPSAGAALATAPSAGATSGTVNVLTNGGANGAFGSAASVVDAAASRAAGNGLQAESDPAYASVFEQLKSRLAAQEAAGTSPAATRAQAATQEQRQSERMVGPRAMLQVSPAELSAVQASAGDALALGTGPARGARGSLQDGATSRTEGAWAAPEFTPTVQYDAGLGGVQAAAPMADGDAVPLAEQLRYWLSQGVTNAEWTVAGDADPVQVSLSLQGNEASITFRSEQAGTRELLASTADQLRDLLQREGLVLSGMSVGAEGSGARGQQAAGDHAGSHTGMRRRAATGAGTGTGPAQAVAAVPAAAARSAGGGVDLFV